MIYGEGMNKEGQHDRVDVIDLLYRRSFSHTTC